MAEQERTTWRRTFNRNVALGAGFVGMLLIVSSLFFVGNMTAWFVIVIVGLVIIQGGVWYAANPILTSERRFLGLRKELDRFVGLVRQLNTAATNPGAEAERERLKADMLLSVERMAELAGKEGEPPPE